jgi:hypothetical protein
MLALLGPLIRVSTYRRAVHLLLGAVILLPYVLLGWWPATRRTAARPC